MSDEVHHEIVIIRRGGHGDHDEHHGGVWKIAFADFMTAMMAFFLVMWLISANDKTRASVARYFNPVRLVDATTQPRGLHDTKKDESGITASPDTKKADDKKEKAGTDAGEIKKDDKAEKTDKPGKDAAPETASAREKRLDTALRENPFVALAEIADVKSAEKAALQPSKLQAGTVGRRGGEAFRDPFAPPPQSAASLDDVKNVPPSADDDREEPAKAAVPVASNASPATAKVAKAEPATAAKAEEHAEAQKDDVKALLAALHSQKDGKAGPQVDLKQTDEGVLLSLTDTAAFSMFASGSAVPARNVVLLMEKVAKVLKARTGTVIVRGFTDNKPYKSGRYDNWHLSLDRAQVTHYMLVRGGLDDTRIGHVEGYADRHAKPGVDPSSAINRRIEILLKDAS